MHIQTDTGALLNLNTVNVVKYRKEIDRRDGSYTGKWEVIGETDQKVYSIQTVSTMRDALDVVETIKKEILEAGYNVIELPEDIPF